MYIWGLATTAVLMHALVHSGYEHTAESKELWESICIQKNRWYQDYILYILDDTYIVDHIEAKVLYSFECR